MTILCHMTKLSTTAWENMVGFIRCNTQIVIYLWYVRTGRLAIKAYIPSFYSWSLGHFFGNDWPRRWNQQRPFRGRPHSTTIHPTFSQSSRRISNPQTGKHYGSNLLPRILLSDGGLNSEVWRSKWQTLKMRPLLYSSSFSPEPFWLLISIFTFQSPRHANLPLLVHRADYLINRSTKTWQGRKSEMPRFRTNSISGRIFMLVVVEAERLRRHLGLAVQLMEGPRKKTRRWGIASRRGRFQRLAWPISPSKRNTKKWQWMK